ncbi:60Kd inner membrane protein-domain-containing protein [Chytridium lagenaria]|nr:60Kd inner membrane protein-domain-containing protein [Chytridium lagenaria]
MFGVVLGRRGSLARSTPMHTMEAEIEGAALSMISTYGFTPSSHRTESRSFWSRPKSPAVDAKDISPPTPSPTLDETITPPSIPETTSPLLDPSLSKDFVGSLNTVLSPDVVAPSIKPGLCNSNPVGLAQSLLEAIYLSTGLPWWGTVMAATVLIRLALFPIVLKTQVNGAKLQNLKPVLEPLNEELVAARKLNDTPKIQSIILRMRQIYKDSNTSPFSVLWGLVQAPVFLSFFFALRGMAELPVPGFETGLGTEAGAGMQQGTAAMKTFFRAMILLFIPLTASLPSVCAKIVDYSKFYQAIFMYWVPSNFFTLGQFLFLRNPRVKKFFGIPAVKQAQVISGSSGMAAFSPPSYLTSLQMVRTSAKKRGSS